MRNLPFPSLKVEIPQDNKVYFTNNCVAIFNDQPTSPFFFFFAASISLLSSDFLKESRDYLSDLGLQESKRVAVVGRTRVCFQSDLDLSRQVKNSDTLFLLNQNYSDCFFFSMLGDESRFPE